MTSSPVALVVSAHVAVAAQAVAGVSSISSPALPARVMVCGEAPNWQWASAGADLGRPFPALNAPAVQFVKRNLDGCYFSVNILALNGQRSGVRAPRVNQVVGAKRHGRALVFHNQIWVNEQQHSRGSGALPKQVVDAFRGGSRQLDKGAAKCRLQQCQWGWVNLGDADVEPKSFGARS